VTPAAKAAAKDAGLSILNWSVDPRDWATRDATAVVQAVVTDVADGDVVLLHDMRGSSVEAALAIVDSLLRRGFQFVTASELAAIRNTLPQPGAVYTRFR
jgi:peptidoglycan/xylan/chitin deacetylase (PgdA/CDA1 family)